MDGCCTASSPWFIPGHLIFPFNFSINSPDRQTGCCSTWHYSWLLTFCLSTVIIDFPSQRQPTQNFKIFSSSKVFYSGTKWRDLNGFIIKPFPHFQMGTWIVSSIIVHVLRSRWGHDACVSTYDKTFTGCSKNSWNVKFTVRFPPHFFGHPELLGHKIGAEQKSLEWDREDQSVVSNGWLCGNGNGYLR